MPTVGLDSNFRISGVQHIDLPSRGATFNLSDLGTQVDKLGPPSAHTAFLREQIAASLANGALSSAVSSTKPPKGLTSSKIFHAALDSGCTGSCTGYLDRLINLRRCNEVYSQANGRLSHSPDKPVLLPVFGQRLTAMLSTSTILLLLLQWVHPRLILTSAHTSVLLSSNLRSWTYAPLAAVQ